LSNSSESSRANFTVWKIFQAGQEDDQAEGKEMCGDKPGTREEHKFAQGSSQEFFNIHL
jgi:hypothetical protein